MDVLSFLVACLGLYLAYLNLSPETRGQTKELVKRLLGSAGRVLQGLLVMSVTILSAIAISLFWAGDGPIARSEVVMLILHFVNLAIYGAMSIATISSAFAKRSESGGAAS